MTEDGQGTFDDLPAEDEGTPAEQPQTLTERFVQFDQANPDFYDALVRHARRYLLRTGAHRVGIQRLIEIARWDLEVETAATDFKVNNDFAAFYSRLIAHREPDLVDAFPMRRAREADEWARTLGDAA